MMKILETLKGLKGLLSLSKPTVYFMILTAILSALGSVSMFIYESGYDAAVLKLTEQSNKAYTDLLEGQRKHWEENLSEVVKAAKEEKKVVKEIQTVYKTIYKTEFRCEDDGSLPDFTRLFNSGVRASNQGVPTIPSKPTN